MCRGFVENERENLKIKAFYTQLTVSRAKNASVLPPDFLTLHFLPRISGGRLEINGSSIRPDSPAFLTLHRAVSEEAGRGFSYGSRERVTVCEGARFEIYVGDVRVLKGVFRKFDDGDDWNMECKCVVSAAVSGVGGAEVAVEAEGLGKVMRQKVEMVAEVRRRRRGRGCCELEEIPEVREEEAGSGACCCSECGGEESVGDGEMEMDVEAVNWAVDVGIWVVCLGVGYMVSASSFRKLRRNRLFH
ncbi:hypothetical protein SASPL_143050 [Salvia splendens]|uniref:Uncharacterized protein n=1 Tax=Salvia splendens TaxID=180675 RepID=A0A8X8WL23_SALSN|nr:uncharacterized protein At1g01500 [Salvia splendens]KAG6396892.1 hypothetical protein SASPL_143050 [Salvia splendens]